MNLVVYVKKIDVLMIMLSVLGEILLSRWKNFLQSREAVLLPS
jgi:hypothetical protein